MALTAADLHRAARLLREVALSTTSEPGEGRVPAGLLAIAEDIAAHPGTTVGAVAARTALAQSLVSRTVARLSESGVLSTSTDPTDRRRTLLRIKPAARREWTDRGSRPVHEALRVRLHHMKAAELARIEAALERLAASSRA